MSLGEMKKRERHARQKEVQEIRRNARKAKKHPVKKERDPKEMEMKTFIFVIQKSQSRPFAYDVLKKARLLAAYAPQFKHDGEIRKATAHARFEILVPFKVGLDILREIQPVWQLGKNDKKEQDAEELQRRHEYFTKS